MPLKRLRTAQEVTSLAKRLQARWIPGEPLRPWLRRNADTLLKLVHGGWSWADIANALEEGGIKYRTEKKWTASWLQSDFHRARMPLKGYGHRKARIPSEAVPAVRATAAPLTAVTSVPPARSGDATGEEFAEPEFKLARFIDWDERRQEDPPALRALPSPSPAPSRHYVEVMEQLTGRKPPA